MMRADGTSFHQVLAKHFRLGHPPAAYEHAHFPTLRETSDTKQLKNFVHLNPARSPMKKKGFLQLKYQRSEDAKEFFGFTR
ncbi:uncharacterized protein LOC128930265 isoform X3 [Callithrix jacchus]